MGRAARQLSVPFCREEMSLLRGAKRMWVMPSSEQRSMMRLYSMRPASVATSIWKSFSVHATLILTVDVGLGVVASCATAREKASRSASSSGAAGEGIVTPLAS